VNDSSLVVSTLESHLRLRDASSRGPHARNSSTPADKTTLASRSSSTRLPTAFIPAPNRTAPPRGDASARASAYQEHKLRRQIVRGLCITLVITVAAFSSSLCFAVPVIVVGDHALLANTSNQTFDIFVTGGDPVQGVNFRVQLADGFPDVPGSTIDGPDITAIDLIGPGTIFEGNNTGQNSVETRAQAWEQRTTTSAGTVAADGLLARITFDTTGFNTIGQQWDLVLANGFLGNTDFTLIGADVTNGTLAIVPEPSSLALVGLGAVIVIGLGAHRKWRVNRSVVGSPSSQMPHLATCLRSRRRYCTLLPDSR